MGVSVCVCVCVEGGKGAGYVCLYECWVPVCVWVLCMGVVYGRKCLCVCVEGGRVLVMCVCMCVGCLCVHVCCVRAVCVFVCWTRGVGW